MDVNSTQHDSHPTGDENGGATPTLMRRENGGGEEQNVAGAHPVAAAAWLRRDRERQRFKADGNQHLASRGSGLHAPFLVVHDRMSSGEQRFWASSFWAPMATASSICAVVGDNEQIWASLFVEAASPVRTEASEAVDGAVEDGRRWTTNDYTTIQDNHGLHGAAPYSIPKSTLINGAWSGF
nr:hypothetical protein Iba_chr08eCG4230 [Ipomoea batatas]